MGFKPVNKKNTSGVEYAKKWNAGAVGATLPTTRTDGSPLKEGDPILVTNGGTVGGVVFSSNDVFYALQNSPTLIGHFGDVAPAGVSAASFSTAGVTKILATGMQLATAIDENENLGFAVSGEALSSYLGANYMNSQGVSDAIDSAVGGISGISSQDAQDLIDNSLGNFQPDLLGIEEFNTGADSKPFNAQILQEYKFEVIPYSGTPIKRYNSFAAAVAAASDGSVIMCNEDATITTALPFKNITINGNGFVLKTEEDTELFSNASGSTPIVMTLINFSEIFTDEAYLPNSMFNPDGNNITINLINNRKISSPVRLVDADGTNCKVNIVNSIIENRKWANSSQNWANASNMADFYTAGCELNLYNCEIRGWNSVGEINDSSSVRAVGCKIWTKYLVNHSWASNQKFLNCSVVLQSSKLMAGVSYGHTTHLNKANKVTITGCDVSSVGDKSLDYGATYESFFCSPNPTGTLIINGSTFKLTPPAGVSTYYFAKAYTGSSIGKIGLNGVVSSHANDSGVSPVFGTLVVSSDLI